MASSSTAAFALGENHQLYGWGFVRVAGLGVPLYPTLIPAPEGNTWTAVAVGDDAWLGLTTSGKLYGWRNGYAGMIQYPPPPVGSKWIQVSIGENMLTLADSGKLYQLRIWDTGWNLTEVPQPAGTTAWTNIYSGGLSQLALANDGNLYSWGYNASGQLGLGFASTQPPWGIDTPQRVLIPEGVTGWKAIATGGHHSLALANDGRLFGWGANHAGQLGLSNTTSQLLPVLLPGLSNITAIAAGMEHSLVIADCTLYAFGANSRGQLGTGATGPAATSPVLPLIPSDICSTNRATLPIVSLVAIDSSSSEATYRRYFYTNTATFRISTVSVLEAPLNVHLAIGGTASNGVDYLECSNLVTIPAGTNAALVTIIPVVDGVPEPEETINVSLQSDAAYGLGNSTNLVISLVDYEYEPYPPIPMTLWLGTNSVGQRFSIQASTNLSDWVSISTNTANEWGHLNFYETEYAIYGKRFFRAVRLDSLSTGKAAWP